MQPELLRGIPKMDVLLSRDDMKPLRDRYGQQTVLRAAREVLLVLRGEILSGTRVALPSGEQIALLVKAHLQKAQKPSLVRVINATGIILHTNLGRAPLPRAALERVIAASEGYANLEYDNVAGTRGSRHTHLASLLSELTGAEDAMVVNNNAAAVLLMLSALAGGREVIISRGELIEIGGSFRIPDIMVLSGATLREVGTTNRTHPQDYERALNEKTGAIMKAHTSNYKVIGFTKETSVEELVCIGKAHGVPVLYDLGGGLLAKHANALIPDEPCVIEHIRAGVDVLCFSGDKLLGGPQAGILLGTHKAIAQCRRHPLARALRVDKMTIAALEGTLALYRDETLAMREIPVLQMAGATQEALAEKAACLMDKLEFMKDQLSILHEESQIGGGTTPAYTLPTVAVAISPKDCGVDALEESLRGWHIPIVARVVRGKLVLDMRTVREEELIIIADCLRSVIGKENAK